MSIIARKIKNTSNNSVQVNTSEKTAIIVGPGNSLENVSVYNYDDIKKYVSIEEDLTEVVPVKEGRVRLND